MIQHWHYFLILHCLKQFVDNKSNKFPVLLSILEVFKNNFCDLDNSSL